MKNKKYYLTFFFLLIIALAPGCSSDKQTKGGLAFIDVRTNYPEKEIIDNKLIF